MGLSVMLTDERGVEIDSVHDPRDHLHALLAAASDRCPTLRHIDWYGLTVFNRPQMTVFIPEWRELASHATGSEATRLVESVAALARRVEKEVHLYLKFVGD